MNEPTSSAVPILIYDGNCGFCRIWIDYWRQLTGARVEYLASQQVGNRFPQIAQEAYKQAVQLVQADGSVTSGGEAVAGTLGLLRVYRMFAAPTEALYRWIASHRDFAYQATRFTFGTQIEPTRFEGIQWIFLRLLGLIYAVAFASLAPQVEGLIGSRGISPAVQLLASLAQRAGAIRFLAIPSIFWFAADDRTLTGMAWCGGVLGGALFITGFIRGRFERLLLVLLFLLYLSFSAIGQDFLSFQWDSLLLETGFLAIFLGRNRIVPWMFRWLAFRLYFLSGAVKLLSGDASWRNLSALSFHYHTQPLPTMLAWYADKLPGGLQHFSTATVLVIELFGPFLIFFPRRIRLTSAGFMIGLQVLIALTGNYTFFNLLAVAILLFTLDDQLVARWVPEHVVEGFGSVTGRLERRVAVVVAAMILYLGVAHFWQTFRGTVPAPFAVALKYIGPLQIVNSYGLFAVMTTTRLELQIEGSADGETWKPYEFPYKPGYEGVAPRWVAPFQPRLDWQMWFAALSNYQSNPWLVSCVVRLLEGSQPVQDLLATNPFPGQPPRYVRAMLYEYTFSTFDAKSRTGVWWTRQLKREYLPPVGLRTAAGN